MVEAVNRYTVRYERDKLGWWVAQVREAPAAITQGRTIAEARRRIREALALQSMTTGQLKRRNWGTRSSCQPMLGVLWNERGLIESA